MKGEFSHFFDMEGAQVGSVTRVLGSVRSDQLDDLPPGDYVVRDGNVIPLAEASPEEKLRFKEYYGD